ncbi:MAG: FkbM family methyltransferase [Puniceicoccales bacterium]
MKTQCKRILDQSPRFVREGLYYLLSPSFRSGTREMKALRALRQKPRYEPGEISLFNADWSYPDALSFYHIFSEIYRAGIYDLSEEKESPLIIDLGANIGVADVFWKMRFPQARILAVEADPQIVHYLEENLRKNRCEGVEVIQKAVWSHSDGIYFQSEGADSGAVTLEATSGDVLKIPTITLTELCGDEVVDLLKVDIEGAEEEVLIGQEDDLKNVRRIFCEYHSFPGRDQRLDELLATFRRAGFRYQLHPQYFSRKPFVKVEENLGMDFRTNIFCWRED